MDALSAALHCRGPFLFPASLGQSFVAPTSCRLNLSACCSGEATSEGLRLSIFRVFSSALRCDISLRHASMILARFSVCGTARTSRMSREDSGLVSMVRRLGIGIARFNYCGYLLLTITASSMFSAFGLAYVPVTEVSPGPSYTSPSPSVELAVHWHRRCRTGVRFLTHIRPMFGWLTF